MKNENGLTELINTDVCNLNVICQHEHHTYIHYTFIIVVNIDIGLSAEVHRDNNFESFLLV